MLIGDTAGWNDPIIGQGLAIAFRDARMVSEILLSSREWSREQFAPYGAERLEQMRRLRIATTFTVDLHAPRSHLKPQSGAACSTNGRSTIPRCCCRSCPCSLAPTHHHPLALSIRSSSRKSCPRPAAPPDAVEC